MSSVNIMSYRSAILLSALLLLMCSCSSLVSAAEKCKPKACFRDTETEKAVCGSDGVTYPNRCLFERARCQDAQLTLARRRGPCREPRTCMQATAFFAQHPEHGFRPQCREDGGYEAVQCHEHTGHCWCVTQQGIPLPYTETRHKPGTKARCGRSKSRKRVLTERTIKQCLRSDKVAFNSKLLSTFQAEWSREHGIAPTNDTVVLEWKFKQLDTDHNTMLTKLELKGLLQTARKSLKPKQCAKWKNFLNSCGVIGDKPLIFQEWSDCFSRSGMDDGSRPPGGSTSDPAGDSQEEDGYEDPFHAPPHGVLSASGGGGIAAFEGSSYGDGSSEIHDEDPTDCLSDRQAALSDTQNQIYVPECTPDGRYQKIQCYKSAGYCWCVNEDTGKNIPGTSVKNGTPECKNVSTILRTMKGCPDEKKVTFLRELLNFLHNRMSENVDSTTNFNKLPWISSKEERAATWSFVVFDKNKNKMLEKKEWKAFKEMVGNVKGLKKCGKKLPRYCDVNKDRQISMTEWLDCLNVDKQLSAAAAAVTSPPSTRFGKKNPLSMLMED